MRLALFLSTLLVLGVSCSSAPAPRDPAESAPSWIQGPVRALDGDTLVYVGTGEDRDAKNALTKAEAFALQDLANDCSLIPQGTVVQDRYEEPVGILYRAFARARVPIEDCRKGKSAQSATAIRQVAQPVFSTQVMDYQVDYDPPEPAEGRPIAEPVEIEDSASLFVARQQLALAKERIAVSPVAPEDPGIAPTTRAIAAFEGAHPEIWNGARAFSEGRPNAINHQAEAVRDTVAERARLQKQYPPMPLPRRLPGKTSGSRRGGGRGGHRSQQPQPQPDGDGDGASGSPGN